jgi:hypothetical protein
VDPVPTRYHNTYLSVFIFCHVALERMGRPGAHMARFLDVTTSAVVHSANPENMGKVGKDS